MSEIFISYARSTAAQAQRVAEALRALGYGVWRDDELPAHRAYGDVIEERLTAARAVVVIWSAEAAKSQWVQSEADRAREDGKLVQLTLDGAKLPMPFDRIQCADLTGWTGETTSPGWRKVAASVADLAGPPGRTPAGAPKAKATGPAAPGISICVLPFVNMSGDAEQEYFSDGISEDIITDLSKVSSLFVVARNTAFTFKGRNVKVSDVARELGVSHVLEGSVRKAGGRVRITAQLVDGATGGHVWAERYDRDLDDIFALQDEISEAIVTALRLRLLPEEKQAIERRGTDNADAYNLYLMARQYYVTGNSGDTRRDDAIIRLCGRAVEIDPGYARAWTLLAMGQSNLHDLFGKGDGGLAAAERALALEPDLAEARAVKGLMLMREGRRAEAAVEVAAALRSDPDSFEVNNTAATLAFNERRLEDAIRHWETATAAMETEFGAPSMLQTCYGALGDEDGVRRSARLTLERAEKALTLDRSNGRAMAHGVAALAALGETDRAREWIARALLIDPDNLIMRYNFACAYLAHLDDRDAALDLLAWILPRASRALVHHAKVDPDLDPLRGDPRFDGMHAEAEARIAAAAGG